MASRACARIRPIRSRIAIIAITVTLASILELLDTSIVNVAIPHMMGNPRRDARRDRLGVDRLHRRQRHRAADHRLAVRRTSAAAATSPARSRCSPSPRSSAATRTRSVELVAWRIIQGLGGGALLSTAQAVLYEVFPPAEYGVRDGHLRHGRDGRADARTDARRLDHRHLLVAVDLLHQHSVRRARAASSRCATCATRASRRRSGAWTGLGLVLLAIGIGTLQTMLERGERQDWFTSREIVT